MKCRKATSYEYHQWQRYVANPQDESLALVYRFQVDTNVSLDKLNNALRWVITRYFPYLAAKFVFAQDCLMLMPVCLADQLISSSNTTASSSINPNGGALFQFRYIKHIGNTPELELAFSHCVFDGGCIAPFLAALESYWQSEVPEPSSPQKSLFESHTHEVAVKSTDIEFWRTYLDDFHLTYNFQHLPVTQAEQRENSQAQRYCTSENYQQFKQALVGAEVSTFQCLAVIFAASICQFDGMAEQELCIAHTVNVKPEGALPSSWSNLLPLCVAMDSALTWREQTQLIKRHRQAIQPHQHVSTLTLLGALTQQQIGVQPFNLVINASEGLLTERSLTLDDEMPLSAQPSTYTTADLTLTYFDDGTRLTLRFDSNGKYFSDYLLHAFADLFMARLADFSQDFDARIDTPAAASTELLKPSSSSLCCESQKASSVELSAVFSEALTHSPDSTAVVDEYASLTYAQLASQVANIGKALTSTLPQGGNVGVLLPRTAAVVATYLACIQCGIPFIPMDASLPEARLEAIAEAADIRGIIVSDNLLTLAGSIVQPEIARINLNALPPSPSALDSAVTKPCQPSDLAYMMFTSGSTGTPKGVKLSRDNLAHFLNEIGPRVGLTKTFASAQEQPVAPLRMANITAVSFDISLLELLLPLTLGNCVVIAPDSVRKDASLLSEWISRHQIDVLQATPSTWRMLSAVNWHAKAGMTLLSGGEALTAEVADYLVSQPARIFNMYGPTEATIWSSCTEVYATKTVTLGAPLNECDFQLRDVAGVVSSTDKAAVGELIITGRCVGLGYANAPENKAFFSLDSGIPAYATGDLVRRVGLNEYVFLKRIDKQLKLNGYRIELDEINAALTAAINSYEPSTELKAVTFSVLRKDPTPMITCFVWRSNASSAICVSTVMEHMSRYLPSYMMPSSIHELDFVPVTSSGKANVKALANEPLDNLPLITRHVPETVFSSPSDSIERSSLLADELKTHIQQTINVTVSDFHRPLGWYGLNSVSYNILAASISQHWDVQFASFEFYRFNTFADLASALAKRLGVSDELSTQPVDSITHESAISPVERKRIAIIGCDALLPNGANTQDASIESFWQGLIDNKNAVTLVADDSQLGDRGLRVTDASGNTSALPGAYLPAISEFDAKFFSISPLEATRMDPRQRLLLQCAWRCIEHAGYANGQLEGTATSCYVAATGADYALQQARKQFPQNPYALPGHSSSILANRISAFLDLRGPSNCIDTACSGSLVAMVKAVRDIQLGIADYALAGGVSLIADTQVGEGLLAGNFMSPNARCATFDANADGYVRGEGVGLFLLKTFTQAQADGDAILGVIESVAENHGGRANSLTAPNPVAQARLLREAYTSDLAQKVSYIETHGTGTQLGDPIEISALREYWSEVPRSNAQPTVWLGAVKSQIGHLEPAAGVASLVKVLQAMQHNCIPSNHHFSALNTQISFSDSPFRIAEGIVPWEERGERVAGISSFGFGGSNAHIVVSDAHLTAENPLRSESTQDNEMLCIPLSAKDAESLQRYAKHLANYLSKTPNLLLRDIAFSLSVGRVPFAYRSCLLVDSIAALKTQLNRPLTIQHCPAHEKPKALTDEQLATQSTTQWSEWFLQGHHLNWSALYTNSDAKRVHLPSYSFSGKPFWFYSR